MKLWYNTKPYSPGSYCTYQVQLNWPPVILLTEALLNINLNISSENSDLGTKWNTSNRDTSCGTGGAEGLA